MSDYLRSLNPVFGERLGEIQKQAYEENIPIVPQETARLLAVLVLLTKPLRILEVGCAVGFSSSLMALNQPPGGTVITIDRYPYMIERARENFKTLNLTERITLLEGDANTVLPKLSEKFDFIFVDAAKGQYGQFLRQGVRLLKTGGLIVFDNVLQHGSLEGERLETPRRNRTIYSRLKAFLYTITNTEGLSTSILPVGDGLAVCLKTQDEVIPQGWPDASRPAHQCNLEGDGDE